MTKRGSDSVGSDALFVPARHPPEGSKRKACESYQELEVDEAEYGDTKCR